MTPTLAIGFKTNPSSTTAFSGAGIRFFPYIYDSTGVDQQWPYPITQWLWYFNVNGTAFPSSFTTDSGNHNLNTGAASVYYQPGDTILLYTAGTLPTGLAQKTMYYVLTATSSAITISLTAGGSAVTYTNGTGSGTWYFSPGSTVPNPIWNVREGAGGCPVTVTVTDSASNTATTIITNAVTIGTAPSGPANDGTYQAVSVFLYNGTQSTIVTRQPPAMTTTGFSNFYLMYPDVVNNLDKMGTATFSLLDVGNSTATDQSLNATGTFVMIFAGQNLIFSGKVQTSNQSTQNGFSSTNAVILWNVTCESDYGKLLAQNVPAAALDPNGYAIIDSPGDIARRILQPVSGLFGDWRGQICCEDIQIAFQLNNSNNLQSAGDIYDKLETLRTQSTYDLRSRMDYLLFQYSGYSTTGSAPKNFLARLFNRSPFNRLTHINAGSGGSSTVTISGASFTVSEFVGCWAIFPLANLASGGASNGTVQAYGLITANTATTITIATCYGATMPPLSNDYVIIARWPVIDFAQDLTQPTPIQQFNVNSTVFGYTDNYNQKKVVTKAVAKGTDVDGVSISVGISAIHSYNVATQFFNNSTYITYPSEGYVYQNTYASDPTPAVVVITGTSTTCSIRYPAFPTEIDLSPQANFPIGCAVTLSGTLTGTGFTAATTYYVVDSDNANYIRLSATRGGTVITATGAGSGVSVTLQGNGGLQINNTNMIFANNDLVAIQYITEPNPWYYGDNSWVCNASAAVSAVNHLGYDQWIQFTNQPNGSAVTVISAGSGVIIYHQNKIQNTVSGPFSPYLWLYGWNLAIPSGTVLYLVNPSGVQIAITTSSAPSNVTMNDGTQCSLLLLSFMPLGTSQNFGGKGFCLSPYIFVQSTSPVYTSGSVSLKVGEETLTVTSAGTHATWGPYLTCTVANRIPSSSLIAYPHGIGAMVAQTDYTESAPQPGSPVANNGLLIQTLTAGSTITYGNLDTYATLTLLGKSTFYPKGSCWTSFNLGYVPIVGAYYGGVQQVSLSMPPRVGDRVYVQKNTSGPLYHWQVVAVEWNFDQGQIILTLGDFEKNVFNLLQLETQGLNWTIT